MSQNRFTVSFLIIIAVLIIGTGVYYSYSKKNSDSTDFISPSTQQIIYHDSKYKFYITLPKTLFDLNLVRNDPTAGDNIYAYVKNFSTNAEGNWNNNDVGVTIEISKDESYINNEESLKYIKEGSNRKDDNVKILESKTVTVDDVPGIELLVNYTNPSLATGPSNYEFNTFFKKNGVSHKISMGSDTYSALVSQHQEYEAIVKSFHY